MNTQAKRPGGGAVGSQATGGNAGGVRVGNTPAVVADIDAYPQRHTSQGDESITSENLPVRENLVQAVDSSEDDVPYGTRPRFFPEPHFAKGTKTLRDNDHVEERQSNTPHTPHPESDGGNNTYRAPIPRQKVEDAKPREGRAIKQEKEQRQSNPRGQR